MVRRIASIGTPESIALLVETLAAADRTDVQQMYLRGLIDALKGKKQAAMPSAWPKAYDKLSTSGDAELRSQATAVAVTFVETSAADRLSKPLADANADTDQQPKELAALLSAGA